MRRQSFAAVVAGMLVFACAVASHAAPRRPAAVQPAPTPPVMRLGNAVKPLAYDAELTIAPTEEKFSGRIAIHLELASATRFFWLNATRLEIRSANLTAGSRSFVAKPIAGGRDFVGMQFAKTIPAGRATLTIEYEGAIDRTETAGIFKQKDRDDWYAYTQFEPIDARRAFPCFDEPGWKVPWHLALVVPKSDVAVANMPVTSEEDLPAVAVASAAAGSRTLAANAAPAAPTAPMKRVRFAPTPPLPSYLIAFAVGPFDVVDGGRAGKKGTPLRYIVPKGHAAETAYARAATPKLLAALEDYFGQAFPYAKLDALAIPITVGFGAMGNVGLITYASWLLLAKPEQESERFRRNFSSMAAHEMSHQWFGDLVTMRWWDDLWLNESFATWMAGKIVERTHPEWLTRLTGDRRRQQAIEVDRLASTRRIRQPVATRDDLANAFDSITYQKGAAVLTMFERKLGEERFRNGVRRYLYEHANGNARAEDFFGALASEAGSDSAIVVPGLKSFVEQPGVPRLDVALDCGADGSANPKLVVSQSRFLPSRRVTDAVRSQRWIVPACFQYGRGGDFNESCTVIREPSTVVPLPSGERCPQWVLPNRGGDGYFVPVLSTELLAQLMHAPLVAEEAVPALGDAATLVRSGDWPIDTALEFAARFANHRQAPVAAAAANLAMTLHPTLLADTGGRDELARYVRKNFGPRARSLGWTPASGEREGDGPLREALLPWVADVGQDAALAREADRLARDWLAGKTVLTGGLRAVLETAARGASGASGRDLVEAYSSALEKAVNNDRNDVLLGLGSFRDPALAAAALDTAFSERVDARDGMTALHAAAADPRMTPFAWRYLRDHYDAIAKRLPEESPAYFPEIGAQLCDVDEKTEFENFLAERMAKIPGGSRNMAQTLEQIDICIASRQLQGPKLKAFLAKP